jgi:hypothetical protein
MWEGRVWCGVVVCGVVDAGMMVVWGRNGEQRQKNTYEMRACQSACPTSWRIAPCVPVASKSGRKWCAAPSPAAAPSSPAMRCRTLRCDAGVSSPPSGPTRFPNSTSERGGSFALTVRRCGELSDAPADAAAAWEADVQSRAEGVATTCEVGARTGMRMGLYASPRV